MNKLRTWLQRWVDRETEKIERVKSEIKQVIAALEEAKTIGELRRILGKEGKNE
jgi:hypothetical protein